ncbi:MAG: hypothetical protein EB060_02250 [Proteobacteria bacterium]|nr:hypothetical protein [Pseudomonadota bacterium]
MAKAKKRNSIVLIGWLLMGFILFVPTCTWWLKNTVTPVPKENTNAVYKTANEVKRGYVIYGGKSYSLRDEDEALFDEDASSSKKLVFYLQRKGEPNGVTVTFQNLYGKGFQVNGGIQLNIVKGEAQSLEWSETNPDE